MIVASIFFFYYLMTGVFKTLSNSPGSSGICPPISLTNIYSLSPISSLFFSTISLFFIPFSFSIINHIFISLSDLYFHTNSISLFIYFISAFLIFFIASFYIFTLASSFILIFKFINISINISKYMPTIII